MSGGALTTKSSVQNMDTNDKDRISLNISSNLKERLRMYGFRNKLNMTYVIEEALGEYLEKRS